MKLIRAKVQSVLALLPPSCAHSGPGRQGSQQQIRRRAFYPVLCTVPLILTRMYEVDVGTSTATLLRERFSHPGASAESAIRRIPFCLPRAGYYVLRSTLVYVIRNSTSYELHQLPAPAVRKLETRSLWRGQVVVGTLLAGASFVRRRPSPSTSLFRSVNSDDTFL